MEQANFFFPLRSCEAVGFGRKKSLFSSTRRGSFVGASNEKDPLVSALSASLPRYLYSQQDRG
jgi:hypothetical protein